MITVLAVLGIGFICWFAGYILMFRIREKITVRSPLGGTPYRSPELVEKVREVGIRQLFRDSPVAVLVLSASFIAACVLSCLVGMGERSIVEFGNGLKRRVTGPDEHIENLYMEQEYSLIPRIHFLEAVSDLDIEDLIEWIRDTKERDSTFGELSGRENFFVWAIRVRNNADDQAALAEYVMQEPGVIFGSWCSESALRESYLMMRAMIEVPPLSEDGIRALIGATRMQCSEFSPAQEAQGTHRSKALTLLRVWQARYVRQFDSFMIDLLLSD